MANLPKLQMHPSGNYIGYISPESIKLETVEHKDVFNKYKDLRMCNYRFISFAPNGRLMAVLMSCSKQYELLVSMIDKGFAFNDRVVDLSKLLPGFRIFHYNEHVECKWSPDSELIAVCSSINFMFILNKDLQLVLNIVADVLPDEVFPSWASTFDFNPCSCHELLAVGTNDRCVYFLNLESKVIVEQTDALSRDAIDCLQYHPFGKYVVIATRNFSLFLLDPCDGTILRNFDMHSETPNLKQIMYSVPNLIRLSFSTTGNQLATSASDGRIRVYQMPQYISLFDLCKWAIFSWVPSTKLNELPLPSQIVSKLLAYPSMK
jgi:WD40 repeat protein